MSTSEIKRLSAKIDREEFELLRQLSSGDDDMLLELLKDKLVIDSTSPLPVSQIKETKPEKKQLTKEKKKSEEKIVEDVIDDIFNQWMQAFEESDKDVRAQEETAEQIQEEIIRVIKETNIFPRKSFLNAVAKDLLEPWDFDDASIRRWVDEIEKAVMEDVAEDIKLRKEKRKGKIEGMFERLEQLEQLGEPNEIESDSTESDVSESEYRVSD